MVYNIETLDDMIEAFKNDIFTKDGGRPGDLQAQILKEIPADEPAFIVESCLRDKKILALVSGQLSEAEAREAMDGIKSNKANGMFFFLRIYNATIAQDRETLAAHGKSADAAEKKLADDATARLHALPPSLLAELDLLAAQGNKDCALMCMGTIQEASKDRASITRRKTAVGAVGVAGAGFLAGMLAGGGCSEIRNAPSQEPEANHAAKVQNIEPAARQK